VRGHTLLIVGCGWIALRHAVAARQLGMPLIFASRDRTRARAYARRFGGLDAFGSYHDAFMDRRSVAALICTPHAHHLPDALAAFDHGKHVLVEKPIARTLEEADAMIDAAARVGRTLMVAENFHFMPAFRAVSDLVASGAVGALRELHLVARGFRRHVGWRLEPAAGGGVLIDGGIHYVHNLSWWGGGVRRLFALRPPQSLTGMSGEDAVNVLAELDGGVVGFVSNSVAAPGLPRWQQSMVTGTRATVFADNRGRFVVRRGIRGTRARIFLRDVRGHVAMLGAFADAIEAGTIPAMDGRAGRRDLSVVLAAYRSLAERCPVEVAC
jgi:predicted dehydrogenase